MKTKKVKVFNAYEVSNEDKSYYTYMGVSNIFDYHNSIINDKGIIKPITPLSDE